MVVVTGLQLSANNLQSQQSPSSPPPPSPLDEQFDILVLALTQVVLENSHETSVAVKYFTALQCFDTIGWATERATGL